MAGLLETVDALVRQAPWLSVVWIALFGGCIGSFMNVVVYRLPAGMSLLYPGSQCPTCRQAIRWHDNLPVISWLRLHGRCRDCKATISPRYPLVEGLMLLMFVNQWYQDVQTATDTVSLGPAIFAFVWHISLLCVLVCVSLIDFDRQTVPVSLLVFGSALPLVMTLTAPQLTAQLLPPAQPSHAWASVLSGAVLAALITFVLRPPLRFRSWRQMELKLPRTWLPLALAGMSGLYLGPERALSTLLLTTLLWRLIRLLLRQSEGGAPWTWYLTAMCWISVAAL